MNKKTIGIVAAVVVVLAIVGIAIALNMNKSGEGDASSKTNQSSSGSTSSNVDPAKAFNPQPLETLSYVATSKTTVNGQTVESTIESDGKGVTKTSSSYGGMTTESYITGDTVVTCVNGECSASTVDANSEQSTALAQDASKYKDSATHVGAEDCPAGTCQVWKATGPAGDVTYYLDDKNRISKIVMAQAETTYDYKDVSITVPTV